MAATRRHETPWLGMRRIDFVRIAVGDDGLTAEAVGVAHRLPAIRPISLAHAVSLSEAGVPTVVRDHRADRL
jgi:hypothetical protein